MRVFLTGGSAPNLDSSDLPAALKEGQQKAAAFCAPRNITIVGASDRPGSWGSLVIQNLLKAGFSQPIQLINPQRTEVAGMPCFPEFARLPEQPDHVVVLVPAPRVPEIIAEAGAAGARTALVMAGGFGEGIGTAESLVLRSQLEDALASSGIALCGPNCMGAFVAKSGLATLTAMPNITTPGQVALIGQSGGVVLHLSTTLAQRGITASHIISSGNEISLTTADYIAHLATDPEVKVIFSPIPSRSAMSPSSSARAGWRVRPASRSSRSGSASRRRAARPRWPIPARSPAAPRCSTRSPAPRA
jgi:acyl-CoA synthetase (NDP forming)